MLRVRAADHDRVPRKIESIHPHARLDDHGKSHSQDHGGKRRDRCRAGCAHGLPRHAERVTIAAMAYQDARVVQSATIDVDPEFTALDPPGIPPEDGRFFFEKVATTGIEYYLWLSDGKGVGRGTLVVTFQLVDIDTRVETGEMFPVGTAVSVNVRPYERYGIGETPDRRVVFVRIHSVSGAAAQPFTSWGIRWRGTR